MCEPLPGGFRKGWAAPAYLKGKLWYDQVPKHGVRPSFMCHMWEDGLVGASRCDMREGP